MLGMSGATTHQYITQEQPKPIYISYIAIGSTSREVRGCGGATRTRTAEILTDPLYFCIADAGLYRKSNGQLPLLTSEDQTVLYSRDIVEFPL